MNTPEVLLQVLEILAPILALAAIGFVWERLKAPYDAGFVTRMVMNVAGPCLVFSTLVQTDLAPDLFGAMIAAALILYALSALAALTLIGVARLETRVYLPALVFGNTGNIGLPLCLYAFGPEGLALAVILFSISTVLTIAAGVWISSGSASPWRGLAEPMVAAAILGAAASLLKVSPPDWAVASLSLAGQTTIPLMLITLGVAVARMELGRLDRAALLGVGRIGLGLAAGLATVELLGLEGVARGVVILLAMTPAAVTTYLFAERWRTRPGDVAAVVMGSTLVSIVAIPVALSQLL